ncbi:hypothetical protein HanRHA438_Chr15g0705091 [Helianthus annuus]|nr:hypothetical protein HanRHA438_Chr15g0705091 [Helianthus annuus]
MQRSRTRLMARKACQGKRYQVHILNLIAHIVICNKYVEIESCICRLKTWKNPNRKPIRDIASKRNK